MGGPVASSTNLIFRVADYIQSPFASGLYLQRGITTCGYIGSHTHLRHGSPSHRMLDDRTYIQVGGVYLLSPLAFAKPRLPSLAHPPRMISGVFPSHSHLAILGTQVLFDRLSSWASDVSPVDSDSSTFAAVALLHEVVSTQFETYEHYTAARSTEFLHCS